MSTPKAEVAVEQVHGRRVLAAIGIGFCPLRGSEHLEHHGSGAQRLQRGGLFEMGMGVVMYLPQDHDLGGGVGTRGQREPEQQSGPAGLTAHDLRSSVSVFTSGSL